jgi:hypothetical protein
MTLRLAYSRPDGGVSIVVAAPKGVLEKALGPLTDQEYFRHVWERSIPSDAIDPEVLPDDWTPPDTDRTYRNAWVKTNERIAVDMPKARNIHREKLRLMRKPKLEALDVEMTRAFKNPARQDQIETRRQALRDVTDDPAIEAAKTPEELKAVMPAALKEE